MIRIAGNLIDSNTIINKYTQNSIEADIVRILAESREVYNYDSLKQLEFEVKLRKSIINASKDLYRSKFSFRVFRKSKCNEKFWTRTNEGGFALNSGIKPSEAIRDIYINSSKYGTECSTAMVIVYYKALVDILPENLFNKLFPDIYLMNWQHLDSDLGIREYWNAADYIPGDCRYFKNPEVDPLSPEWQGENVFDIGNKLYYGHGIGIASAEKIIELLNKKRIAGAKISAYLIESAKRPNFKYLSNIYHSFVA